MANPQTQDGFVQVAHDLFAVILSADLPNREMIVLAEVLLRSYGRPKERRVHLDPATLEHYTGLHRNNVRRGIKGLVEANILIVNDDGSYSFNKNWESWTPGGISMAEARAGGTARFARSAAARFNKRPNKSTSGPIQEDCEAAIIPIHLDSPTTVGRNPVGLSSTSVTESNGIAPLYKDRGREKSEKGEEENQDKDSSAGSVSAPPAEFVQVCREAQKVDALKAAGFPKALHDAWPKDGKLQAVWHMTRPDSWRKALAELAGADPSKMVPRYYLTIVSRIDARPVAERPAGIRPSDIDREEPFRVPRRPDGSIAR